MCTFTDVYEFWKRIGILVIPGKWRIWLLASEACRLHAVEKKIERLLTVIVSIKITTQDYGRPQLLPYLAWKSALNISQSSQRTDILTWSNVEKGNIVLKEYSSSLKIENKWNSNTL